MHTRVNGEPSNAKSSPEFKLGGRVTPNEVLPSSKVCNAASHPWQTDSSDATRSCSPARLRIARTHAQGTDTITMRGPDHTQREQENTCRIISSALVASPAWANASPWCCPLPEFPQVGRRLQPLAGAEDQLWGSGWPVLFSSLYGEKTILKPNPTTPAQSGNIIRLLLGCCKFSTRFLEGPCGKQKGA